jgi:hypothetical protein
MSFKKSTKDGGLPKHTATETTNITPRPAALIPENPPASVDLYGTDKDTLALVREVVDTYKFMIHVSIGGTNNESGGVSSRALLTEDDLLAHCFPERLSSLNLEEGGAIGYVYKCLGAALYAFTRNLSGADQERPLTPDEAFKRIITEIALEGGDADTNGEK